MSVHLIQLLLLAFLSHVGHAVTLMHQYEFYFNPNPGVDCFRDPAVSIFPLTSTCTGITANSISYSWFVTGDVIGNFNHTVVLITYCPGTINCATGCGNIQFDVNQCTVNLNNVVLGVKIIGSSTSSSTTAAAGGATNTSSQTTKSPADGGKCFHESTLITYQGFKLTLDHPEPCYVPHVLEQQTDGIIIETSEYAVWLTAAHLVYSQARGLVRADSLVPHVDVVFADLDEHEPLPVLAVRQESSPQRYFALNCPAGSNVLANGIKTSTFDTLHMLPALWMRLLSPLLGIERTSKAGDWLAAKFWHK